MRLRLCFIPHGPPPSTAVRGRNEARSKLAHTFSVKVVEDVGAKSSWRYAHPRDLAMVRCSGYLVQADSTATHSLQKCVNTLRNAHTIGVRAQKIPYAAFYLWRAQDEPRNP